MRKGRLSLDVIGEIPKEITTKYHYDDLSQCWEENKHRGNYALFRSMLSWYKWKIFGLFLIQLIISFAENFEPLLLKEVLNYIESDDSEDHKSRTRALIFAGLTLASMLLSNIITENMEFYMVKFEVQLRQALISMMYSKVLRVSPATNRKFDKGRLVNMILNDSNNINFVFEQIPLLLVVPFTMLFILISMYLLIGYVIIVGIALVLLFSIINYFLARLTAMFQKIWFKYIDKRINKITECLDNIKIIKFNWWMDKYWDIVNKARNLEISMYVKKQIVYIIYIAQNTLEIPILEIGIFFVAIFYAKMGITVASGVALRKLIQNLK